MNDNEMTDVMRAYGDSDPDRFRFPLLPLQMPGPIPRRIHQVWIGSEPPDWVKEAWTRWDAFLWAEENYAPEGEDRHWELYRWTDETIKGVGPLARLWRMCRDKGLNQRGTADLLRIFAVMLFGGVYLDADTAPILSLEPYVGDRKAWIGSDPSTATMKVLSNAMFGFPPGHPFLASVLAHAERQLNRGVRNEHFVAGPVAWRTCFEEWDAMAHPLNAVEARFNWVTTDDTRMQNAMKKGLDMTPAGLAAAYPGSPALHVVFADPDKKGLVTW